MKAWAKEKAYNKRRAEQLTAAMNAAIATNDLPQFLAAYEASFRYMTAKQRRPFYIRMIERRKQHE